MDQILRIHSQLGAAGFKLVADENRPAELVVPARAVGVYRDTRRHYALVIECDGSAVMVEMIPAPASDEAGR